jgi:hypothetical protein
VAGRYARDPISVEFDAAALKLLRRAHANLGGWAGTYVKNPSLEWQAWALANGWPRLLGPDPVPSGDARTAWCRSLVRSCYYNNKKFMYLDGLRLDDPKPTGGHDWRQAYALDFEVGTVRIAQGGLTVIGRAFRIKLHKQGGAKTAAKKLDPSKRWLDASGHAGPAHSGWSYTG